jgi:hypothetical protein
VAPAGVPWICAAADTADTNKIVVMIETKRDMNVRLLIATPTSAVILRLPQSHYGQIVYRFVKAHSQLLLLTASPTSTEDLIAET